jgi:hypothetical protein
MAKCWETRGCDEEMQAECAHVVEFFDNCPTKCAFAGCDRPSYLLVTDPEILFDPTVDRTAAIKDGCQFCGFFLKNGPRVSTK